MFWAAGVSASASAGVRAPNAVPFAAVCWMTIILRLAQGSAISPEKYGALA